MAPTVYSRLGAVFLRDCRFQPARTPGRARPARWLALFVGPLLYYALWLLVGRVFRSLQAVGA